MVTRDQAVHLLRRTEFVARPERVTELTPATPLTLEAAVDNVLNVPVAPVTIPASLATHVDGSGNYAQLQTAVQWWFDRMARQPITARPIQEKMTVFWHGHFCSEWGKVFHTPSIMGQNQLFRDTGTTGNVRDLAKAMAIQPAMLVYLDNVENTKLSPNQNFGRELLELFLLGVGNYTEAEVEACTLAWTGHNLDWNTRQYAFRTYDHAYGNKTMFGQTADFDGPGTQGVGVIDLLLGPNGRVTTGPNAGQETRRVAARFLSKKLWEAFAYEAPAPAIVDALADALVANDFAIKPWLRTMLLRDEFYSTAATTGLVRTPTEYMAALIYHSGMPSSQLNPEWWGDAMGQALFYPPNVSGWRVNRYWINSSALAGRAAFAEHVRWNLIKLRTSNQPLKLAAGTWTWAQLDAMTPEALIDTLAGAFHLTLSAATRSTLVAWARAEVTQWQTIDWWRSTNAILLMMLVPETHVA